MLTAPREWREENYMPGRENDLIAEYDWLFGAPRALIAEDGSVDLREFDKRDGWVRSKISPTRLGNKLFESNRPGIWRKKKLSLKRETACVAKTQHGSSCRMMTAHLNGLCRFHGGASSKAMVYEGFIYFVRPSRASGALTKIGFASDLKKRLQSLQIGSPEPLEIIAAAPADKSEEHMLHEFFAAKRVRGEWFDLTDDDLVSASAQLAALSAK